jgi:hypothetical protein
MRVKQEMIKPRKRKKKMEKTKDLLRAGTFRG